MVIAEEYCPQITTRRPPIYTMLPYYMVRAPPLSLGAATEPLLVVENPMAAMFGGVPNLIAAKTSILLEHSRRKELGTFKKAS
jgi:hypothetical protein